MSAITVATMVSDKSVLRAAALPAHDKTAIADWAGDSRMRAFAERRRN
jgi:hypothetical protein